MTLQAHLVLESNLSSRLILHWIRLTLAIRAMLTQNVAEAHFSRNLHQRQASSQPGVLREDLNFRGLRLASPDCALLLPFRIINYQLWQLSIPPLFVSKDLHGTYIYE